MDIEDYEIDVPEELVGTTWRFEIKEGKIAFSHGVADVEGDVDPNLIGFKGTFLSKKIE